MRKPQQKTQIRSKSSKGNENSRIAIVIFVNTYKIYRNSFSTYSAYDVLSDNT